MSELNLALNFDTNFKLISQVVANDKKNIYQRYASVALKYFFNKYDLNSKYYLNFTYDLWKNTDFSQVNYLFKKIISLDIKIGNFNIFKIFWKYDEFLMIYKNFNYKNIAINFEKLLTLKNVDIKVYLNIYNQYFKDIKEINLSQLSNMKTFVISMLFNKDNLLEKFNYIISDIK